MTAPLVFIDGDQGTTGLQIQDRLRGRSDLRLLTLPETERRDPEGALRCGAGRRRDRRGDGQARHEHARDSDHRREGAPEGRLGGRLTAEHDGKSAARGRAFG